MILTYVGGAALCIMTYKNTGTWNDRWIVETVFNKKQGGFFVEAGAMHWKWSSCTYVLEKHFGWTGVLVEPSDQIFDEIVKNRPNSKCINACLTDKEEIVDFIQIEGQHHTGCGGVMKYVADETGEFTGWKRDKLKDIPRKKVKRKGIPLAKVLNECNAPKIIDYMALDVEQSEDAILCSFPFNKYKALSVEGGWGCYGVLMDNGYQRVSNPWCREIKESYFIHKDFIEIKYLV